MKVSFKKKKGVGARGGDDWFQREMLLVSQGTPGGDWKSPELSGKVRSEEDCNFSMVSLTE